MPSPRLSMRHACMFVENAFLELLDILAWQEGAAPPPSTRPHGQAGPRGASRKMVSPDRGRERN
ncbi:hypothetical protein [Komagataeibacter swingsii]|uniref:Uncharacterized protein n=1 Tax=Komagataeibacter swingsii TaxID=215220 RepID=A0A850P0Z0_9PROT|nr:hypothetical protein [Komagataeibacter swingsii]AHI25588.1 hypothetical protein H845_1645 [Komagataeibacter xylinus E25]NVN36106.1 hypothetical protein [Komagataeibacter swingsii]RFP02700.1 hypothetical protein BGC31_11030 [Komagataeibacter xylinus]RFP07229.1 hypothetical protein BFX83_02585 [Komagataeibacter xylinus]